LSIFFLSPFLLPLPLSLFFSLPLSALPKSFLCPALIEQFLLILIPKQVVDFGFQYAEVVLDSFNYLISGHDGLLVFLVFGPVVAGRLVALPFAGLVHFSELEFAGGLLEFGVGCHTVEGHDGFFGRFGGSFTIGGEFWAEAGFGVVICVSEYLWFHNFPNIIIRIPQVVNPPLF
jgi:hypothetical protein